MSLSEVAEMSLDQIFMLLTDRSFLKSKGVRSKSYSPSESNALMADKDGYVKGRSIDGKPIRGKIGGMSLVGRLRKELEEKQKKEKEQEKKSKRTSRRGRKKRGT